MTAWGVFGVITAVVSFCTAVVVPLIKLNTSITTLTVTMKSTADSLKQLTSENTESHKRMHEQIDVHSQKLSDHEVRITVLERSNKND